MIIFFPPTQTPHLTLRTHLVPTSPHRAILHFPALPLYHFPIGLQHHVWHCNGLNLLARIIWYRGKAHWSSNLRRPDSQSVLVDVLSLVHHRLPVYPLYPRPQRLQRGSESALKSTRAGFGTIHKGNTNTTRNLWQIELVFTQFFSHGIRVTSSH